MTPRTAAAVSLVTVAIVAVLAVVYRLIDRDRDQLVARFSAERLRQLDEAAREIRADLDDISDALRFAGQLVETADTAADRERELRALTTVVRHYRMVRVLDASGNSLLSVADSAWRLPIPPAAFDAFVEEVAASVLGKMPGEVETSGPLAGDPTGWLRVFATPLPSRQGVVAIVVDVEPLLRPMRLLAAQRGTRLLILSANGQPVPMTDVQLTGLVDESPLQARGTAALLAKMRSGEHGLALIPRAETVRLQLGNEEAIAAYGPVPLPGGSHWSLATVSDARGLREDERALLLRFGAGAGAIVLFLVLFGAYVVITERRSATDRERLRQAAEMERLQAQLLRAEKMATVGVLAAGIAHEVGTPLGVVRARAEMTLEQMGTGHVHASSLRIIMEQIDRVARTIRQLLNFSRAQQPAVQSVDLAQAARSVQELLMLEGERRGVAIAVDVPAGLPRVAADPDQLQQALVNLVMNGLDACNGPGRVEIAAREDSGVRGRPRALRIQIKDTGCGIPAELRHQIFDPFFTTKKRGKGTGLGLTMTARIVESHAGDLLVDSAEGQGTTITLRWPAADVAPASAPPAEAIH